MRQNVAKKWDRKITSERQSLRETVRIWRHIARTDSKPKTSWLADCPLCEWTGACRYRECLLVNFWGAVPDIDADMEQFTRRSILCENSKLSAYNGWRCDVGELGDEVCVARSPKYYAMRIRWAALRVLHDHFSS